MKIIVIVAHQLLKIVLHHLVVAGVEFIICKIRQGQGSSREVQVQVKNPAMVPVVKKAFQFPTGCTKLCCNGLIFQSQQKKLTVFRNEKWEIPKTILLTKFFFDIYDLKWIKKIKCMRKLEPYSSQIKENLYIMKVDLKNEDTIYASDPEIIEEYFKKIIFAKLIFSQFGVQPNKDFSKEVQGNLLKKSDYLGKWEKVYAKINQKEGLKCHQKQNKPHNLQIKYIKEIETQFQFQLDQYLIVKLKKTKSKRQFAINVHQIDKWIPAFLSLLNNPQNQIENEPTH